MSEKDEDHRLKELTLEERHSRELAMKSQKSAEEMAKGPADEGAETGDKKNGGAAAGLGNGRSSKVGDEFEG